MSGTEHPGGPGYELPDDLLGLDPSDPETQAFAEHLHRMRHTHPTYTVEGYLDNVGEFANSANRAQGHRRLMALILVCLVLLGVGYAIWEALTTIVSILL